VDHRSLQRELAVALALLLGGCATSVSLHAGPTLSTNGHVGGEATLQGRAAGGDEHLRFYTALSGGGGLAPGGAPATWLLAPEAGVETGTKLHLGAGGVVTVRHLGGADPTWLTGAGASGELLFNVKRMGGEDGSLLIGPRVQVEYELVPEPRVGAGLFSAAFVLRWTTFDATARSWSF